MQTSSYTRNVLVQYHKQLVASRVLNYRGATAPMPQIVSLGEAEDKETAKKRLQVNKVAKEVFANLLAGDSHNPMINEVKAALAQEFGQEYIFHYPIDSDELMILTKTEIGYNQIDKALQAEIAQKAWNITLNVVESYVV